MNVEKTEFVLDGPWLEWIRENLRLGVSELDLIAAMVGRGCAEGEASALLRAFTIAGEEPTNRGVRLAKSAWLLESLRILQRAGELAPIAERREIDPCEFFEHFYSKNFPVVYRGSRSASDLSDLLSWDRLGREFGDLAVEVQEGRKDRADYERSSNELKSRARLADFLQRVRTAGETNDFYMTANNSSANSALIESALRPEDVCPDLLDGSKAHGCVFLWIGPQGTFTPAHHDLTNNLFMQIQGAKEFRLAPSLALLDVENDRHCYLASSLSNHDERRHIEGLEPLSFTVTVAAGDVLFIPLGWWHEVRGLSPSISVSATNFRARNDFHRSYTFFGPLDH